MDTGFVVVPHGPKLEIKIKQSAAMVNLIHDFDNENDPYKFFSVNQQCARQRNIPLSLMQDPQPMTGSRLAPSRDTHGILA